MELRRERQEQEIEAVRLLREAGDQGYGQGQGKANLFKPESVVKLLPKWHEDNIDIFFEAFERVAVANNWPLDKYVTIIQTQFSSKAQNFFLALANRVTYAQLKEALLRACELIAEVDRQKFRSYLKSEKETFSDHAYNLNVLFTKWLTGLNCFSNLDRLKQILLLERFFDAVPENLKLWLIDQDPTTLEEAARLVDTYEVNHKVNARPSCVKPSFAV